MAEALSRLIPNADCRLILLIRNRHHHESPVFMRLFSLFLLAGLSPKAVCLPVRQEAAGSNPVAPANSLEPLVDPQETIANGRRR